jgi:hypothetical protein
VPVVLDFAWTTCVRLDEAIIVAPSIAIVNLVIIATFLLKFTSIFPIPMLPVLILILLTNIECSTSV